MSKPMKVLLEVEVPGDTKVTEFAIVADRVREVFARVGYKCKVLDIVDGHGVVPDGLCKIQGRHCGDPRCMLFHGKADS